MENAVDALKIAFGVFVFTMAISITMYMFNMAKETSDVVLQSSDVTALMEYVETSDMIGEERIVGLETIIPTLYKYFKENYTVIFLESDGTPMELYETQTDPTLWSPGYTNKYYDNNQDIKVCSFDVDEETRRREPWTGNTNYYKQNLDMFLSGGTFVSPSGNGMDYDYSDNNGWGSRSFIDKFSDSQFRESLGEYTYNDVQSTTGTETANVKPKKKRVIVYTLVD